MTLLAPTPTPTTTSARLIAAIEKLIDLRDGSIFGPWQHGDALDGDTNPGEVFHDGSMGSIVIAATNPEHRDADLIVALHATIEPQLDLLRLALEWAPADGHVPPVAVRRIVELGLRNAAAVLEGPLL